MKFHCASKSKMLKGVGGGQLQVLGDDFSRWMLLERVLFTLDGLECNKIGVGYEAFRSQPNFCSSPLDSCLGDQLSKFWEVTLKSRSVTISFISYCYNTCALSFHVNFVHHSITEYQVSCY